MPTSIVPSFPAPSYMELERVLKALSGVATGFQVDIVDGQFVPFTSWPFTESDPQTALMRLQEWTAMYELEVDCMVTSPEQYLDTLVALGAKRVVVHMGSTTKYEEIIAHARTYGYQLGFAATSAVPISELLAWVPEIDYVQLMGIKAVGQQGQPFDRETLDRATTLRMRFPDLEIAVDGSVNSTTIPQLYAAGVTRFAPGSAITRAEDPVVAYQTLRKLLQDT